MESIGALEINKSIKTLLAQLKSEIDKSKKTLPSGDFNQLSKRIGSLEKLYDELLAKSKSKDSFSELLNIQSKLEESKANLISQINNTIDNIWSVDTNLQIKTLNSNFASSYKIAFGVSLKEGLSVLISLPEPLKSIWKERYQRALKGEQFSIVDRFDIENVPQYTETSFNPVKLNKEIVGVACFSRDITLQKQSEEQFKQLAKLSPNPISIISNEGYLYVNKAWEKTFGYSRNEALEEDIHIFLVNEGKTNPTKNLKEHLLKSKNNTRKTYNVKTRSNKEIWLDIASTPIEFNKINAVLSVSTDISELHSLQNELKQNRANLLALFEATEARIWSIDTKFNIVALNSNFKSDFKAAFNVNLEEGVSALEGVPEPIRGVWLERYEKSLSGEKINLIEEFELKNAPQFVEVSLNPIKLDNKIVGVSCYSRDISEQKRAENALIESEQRFKTLVDNLPSTAYRCAYDKHWTMEFISEEIETLSGFPSSDFINNSKRSYVSIIHLEDKPTVERAVKQGIGKNKNYRIEYRIVHKNGTIKWVHERGRSVWDEDENLLWLDGVISDITSRKQAESALRESEEQYRAIFNSMSDVFIRTDLRGNIVIVTPSIIDLFGYTPEEIIGRPISELFKEPKDRKGLVAELSNNGFVREYETVFKTRNGEEKTASINANLLINSNGKPYGMEGIARDITYRKMAQKALEERTRELDSIFENTPIILMLIDSMGRVLNINKAGSNYSDLEKSNFTSLLAGETIKCVNSIRINSDCGKGEDCKNCIIRSTINKTFHSKLNQNQIEGSLTIVRENQEIERRFLISTAYIHFEEDDRVLISLDDITEIREAEEEIRRLSAAVNQSTATIVITNIKGNIEYVNPQFEKSTGYKTTEAIGQNPRILRSLNTPDEIYKELWKTILSGKTWHGEFLNSRKDKSEYWESANISPITDRNGEITHFIAIKEDITEKKRIQEELVKSEKDLREISDEKTRYLSILAHDLRGLVGSFHAYSNLIQTHFDDFSEKDMREQIDLLSKASGDSLNLLDNLLAWGKSTQGRLTLDIEKVDLHKQVDLVLGVLSEVANNKQIQLINNTLKNTLVGTDINVFQTIVRNLINNAIKFTPTKGTITISSAQLENNMVEISVSDTGIGIDEKIINKLFKMGEKIVREGTNNELGTGLGLVICKEMVSRLGGSIDVESIAGKGSRFFFSIPDK